MKWHRDNTETWSEFEKFLRQHLPRAISQASIGKPFRQTALDQVSSGPLKPVVSVASKIMIGFMWPTDPHIWVDRLDNAAAIYSMTNKVIVVNRRIVKNFERSPLRQDFRNALEMLMLHELLHWLIHDLGGKTEHFPRGDKRDAVYNFENAAFTDWENRNRTLEIMNV